MRPDVVNTIANAEPDELAAGIIRSRLETGRRTRLRDGRTRLMVYLPPPLASAGPDHADGGDGLGRAREFGLDTGPSKR